MALPIPASENPAVTSQDVLHGTAAVGTDVIADYIVGELRGNGWCVVEGLGLDDASIEALRGEVRILHQAGKLEPAAIGRGAGQHLAPDIRGDRTAWLDGESAAQTALFRRLTELQRHLNRTLFLGLTHFEAHFAAFEPGAFYRPHRDSFQGRASRLVSLVLYLNENWQAADGGSLRIYDPGSPRRVAAEVYPESGRAACFLSEEVLHEVVPAERLRYSVACWFRADIPGVPVFNPDIAQIRAPSLVY